jgi:hypothetical protein
MIKRHKGGQRCVPRAIKIDHHTHKPDDLAQASERSLSVEMAGCEHTSSPLSGNLPRVSLNAGSK